MHEELAMTELTATEMDAVAGGFLSHFSQNNWAVNTAVSIADRGGESEATAFSFQSNSIRF